MFEFHGWVAVKFDDAGKKASEASVAQINTIRALIEEQQDQQAKIDIFYQNGQPFVRFDGMRSHYQGWVLQLFFAINNKAPLSEGLLMIKDEENPCFDSRFRVWQMMDGEVLSGDMTFFPDKYNHHNMHIA